MVEAIGYSWNQEEAALYAEGKGTEAGQVLQATNNSKKGCHTSQSTWFAADSAQTGSMEGARTCASLQNPRGGEVSLIAVRAPRHSRAPTTKQGPTTQQGPMTQQGPIMTMIWNATRHGQTPAL